MFNTSKYTNWYFSIIARAKSQVLHRRPKGYHNHHIIPSSLGGSEDRANKVLLTYREHFVCHLLLLKMTVGVNRSKMAFALHRFGGKNLTSKTFALASSLISQALSGEGNPFFGKHLSPEHRAKITGENHGMFGKYCKDLWVERFGTEEAEKLDKQMKQKRSKSLMGEGNGMFGKTHPDSWRQQHSTALTGRKGIWKNGKQKRIRPEDFDAYIQNGWSFTKSS